MISDDLKLDLELIFLCTMADTGGGSKNFSQVIHFKRTGVPPFPGIVDLLGVATVFYAQALAAWKDINVAGTTTVSLAVRCINDATDGGILHTVADVGVAAGARGDSFDAVSFTEYTGMRGKSYRGAKHIGGVPEGLYVSDRLTAGAVTKYNAYATAALVNAVTDGNGNTWAPSIVSRKLSQLKVNPTTVVSNFITSVKLQHRVGTMRKRRTIGQLA